MMALALRLKPWCFFLKIFANIFFYSDKFSLFSLKILLSNRNTAKEEKENFSGKRIQRGLYRTSDGTVLNADINGAANILRKAGYDTSSVILTNLLNPEVFAFADLNR